HGMRWTTLRGLKKLSMQAMLTFAAINLKKMANWTWQGPKMAYHSGLVEPQSLNFRRKFKGNFKRGSEFFNSEPLLSTN
ncbi:transposase, partial [Peribacillus frigoritolerans]|uniref:transposase n=1 Tax=Peribacillus frigoritolerans TaxID=450367 RepID=UPI0035CEC611